MGWRCIACGRLHGIAIEKLLGLSGVVESSSRSNCFTHSGTPSYSLHEMPFKTNVCDASLIQVWDSQDDLNNAADTSMTTRQAHERIQFRTLNETGNAARPSSTSFFQRLS